MQKAASHAIQSDSSQKQIKGKKQSENFHERENHDSKPELRDAGSSLGIEV